MSFLKTIGRGAGGDAAGKAAKEAAEKTAKETAEKTAKANAAAAAAKTARESAEKAAKESAEKTAKEALEKQAKEAGERAAKEAAEKGASEASQLAAKEAAEKGVKEAGEKGVKEAGEKAAKEAGEAAEKQGKDAAEKAAKEAAEKEGKDYTMYAAAAAAAGIGLYTYGKGADEAERSNNTPRGITSITSNTGTKYDVSYTPAIRILKADSMVISSSSTIPKIDGPQVVSSVISDSQIVIDFGVTLTSNAAGGSIKVTTTPEDQAVADIADAAAAAAALPGDFFSGILDALGLSSGTFMWIGIALGVLCFLGVFFMIMK
jgi:chemotaxis protein histidine kinase CheA